jgi:hypothetical protein
MSTQVQDWVDYTLTRWQLPPELVRSWAWAWAWQSGLIEFGREVPEGAIGFANGRDVPLRKLVGVLARHGQGKSEGKLLVPGVPEAETRQAKIDALIAWVDWCAKGNDKKESDGVVFINRVEGKSS